MEKSNKGVLFKILTFPEKLGTLVIYLLIALLLIGDAFLIVFAVPKVDYTYVPTYVERKEYDWMNPYIRSITGYYEDEDGKVYSSMTVTCCYFGVDINHKATKTLGSFTIVDENDEIYYVGDIVKSTSTSYSTTSTPLSRLSKSLSGIKTIYGKVEYDQMLGGEKQKSDVICFKEDVIDLSSKSLKNINFGSNEDISEIISKYSVVTKNENNKTKIENKFDFVGNKEYHFDYQLFAVDKKGKTYDLIGIYNFSNNYSRYLSLDTKMPEKVEIDYYVGVFKTTINNEEKTIYIKKLVTNIEE